MRARGGGRRLILLSRSRAAAAILLAPAGAGGGERRQRRLRDRQPAGLARPPGDRNRATGSPTRAPMSPSNKRIRPIAEANGASGPAPGTAAGDLRRDRRPDQPGHADPLPGRRAASAGKANVSACSPTYNSYGADRGPASGTLSVDERSPGRAGQPAVPDRRDEAGGPDRIGRSRRHPRDRLPDRAGRSKNDDADPVHRRPQPVRGPDRAPADRRRGPRGNAHRRRRRRLDRQRAARETGGRPAPTARLGRSASARSS